MERSLLFFAILALQTMTASTLADSASTAHSAVTLALAKKELAQHLEGMDELYQVMRQRPLKIKAYLEDDPQAPELGDNVKLVHFVRHGQGFHNLLADLAHANGKEWRQFERTPDNPYLAYEILDAPLTEKGRQQALALQPRVAAMRHLPQLVVFSPNCRALQTGLLVFESLLGQVPMLAHEMVREETGVHACDKRRPKSRQAREFPQVDFSLLEHEEDPLHRDERRETKLELGERLYAFLEWLAKRPEQHVAVNSHSGWLLALFNGVCDCQDNGLLEWFQTGEMRSVKLEFVHEY